jgi:GTP-binding protein
MQLFSEATFLRAASRAQDLPPPKGPEVAFAGRSNVGKSSAINAICGRRSLARTSKTPGRTQTINFYDLGTGARLADLPGYGYARGGQASVAELAVIAESYFRGEGLEGVEGKQQKGLPSNSSTPSDPSSESRYRIAGVLHLVDSRHPGLEADLEAGAWLDTIGVNRTVLATKIDKLSRSERAKNLKAFERQLGTAPLPISAVKGEGLDDLWTLIARLSRQR